MGTPDRISARELENRVADIVITNVHRADHGELEAAVTVRGETVAVTRRSGSWGIQRPGERSWIDVISPYKDLLQERARAFERKEGS